MGWQKYVIGIPMFVFSVLGAWISYIEYKDWRHSKPIVPQKTVQTAANRSCLIAEAAEGAASENDQVMIVVAALRVASDRNIDPCFLFSRYTLMRAPSDEDKLGGLRDPDAVELKTWLQAFASRHASATIVVDRVIAGNTAFAKGEDDATELKRHQMLMCVTKYSRVWWFNTSRTNVDRLNREMGQSFISPIGTVFWCPKK